LEEDSNMKSVQNWISYIHANSWSFSPFIAILIIFLMSKTDLDFPKFSFEIHFESGDVTMEEVVPFFKAFSTILYFQIFELGNVLFDSVKFKRI
jgi:hypothetical protein